MNLKLLTVNHKYIFVNFLILQAIYFFIIFLKSNAQVSVVYLNLFLAGVGPFFILGKSKTSYLFFILDLFIKIIFIANFFDLSLLSSQLYLILGVSIYSIFILLSVLEFRESIYITSKEKFSLSFPHHSLKIRVRSGEEIGSSRLLDFSKSSAYLFSELNLKRNQKLEVLISISSEVFEVPAKVLTKSGSYYGIGFEDQMIFRPEQNWAFCYDTMSKMKLLSRP